MFQKFGAKMVSEEKPSKKVIKAEAVATKVAAKQQAPAAEEEKQPHYECFRF